MGRTLVSLVTPALRFGLRFAWRRQRVYVVYGARRSGNHAFVNWLASAIRGSHVEWRQTGTRELRVSEDGSIVSFNNATAVTTVSYFRAVVAHWRSFNRAGTVIVSIEDEPVTARTNARVPFAPVTEVYVRRTLLNVIASRLRGLRRGADEGKLAWGFALDGEFLARLASWASASGLLVWDYDRWLTDEAYRRKFLGTVGLSTDLSPQMSTEGGGSSFTGKAVAPDAQALLSRYESVAIPAWLSRQLLGVYASLLSREERQFLEDRDRCVESPP